MQCSAVPLRQGGDAEVDREREEDRTRRIAAIVSGGVVTVDDVASAIAALYARQLRMNLGSRLADREFSRLGAWSQQHIQVPPRDAEE